MEPMTRSNQSEDGLRFLSAFCSSRTAFSRSFTRCSRVASAIRLPPHFSLHVRPIWFAEQWPRFSSVCLIDRRHSASVHAQVRAVDVSRQRTDEEGDRGGDVLDSPKARARIRHHVLHRELL